MSNLSVLFIRRPVLTTVVSLLILLFGIIGYFFLSVREYPNVDPPVVTVSTSYPGANADVIESQITEPLEESINGIEGIRTLNSTSRDGASNITVEFEIGRDMEAAANDVRDRVSRAIGSLPPDVNPPVVVKSDADASPIFALSVQSTTRSLIDLSDLANLRFKERLQTIEGVSEVRIWGEKRYSMKLYLDPVKLAGYGLAPGDIREALNRENIELPSGRIEGYSSELSIRTFGRLTTEEEFNNLIIREINGIPVKIRDVGRSVLAPENERTLMRGTGGIPMVGVAITPQPGSNHIAIVDKVKQTIELISRDLPADVRTSVMFDTTQSIRKGIVEVAETILIAFGLVVLIIFLFLRHWRTTLIPVVAIPISLIGSFFIMYVAGFSINILTLLSIVLATGLVVDDAIVVMENIYTKIERGMKPPEAAIAGTSEIFFAIVSTTITLAAVFLPVIFLQGLTGSLFREFGLVMAGSVIISAVVSLTLTPMMSGRLLHHYQTQGRLFNWSEDQFNRLAAGYRNSLSRFIGNRWATGLILAVSVALVVVIWPVLPAELAPLEDRGRMTVQAIGPEGTSFERMDAVMNQLIGIVDTIPEVNVYIAITAPGFGSAAAVNSGFMRIGLTEADERDRTQQEIADELGMALRKVSSVRVFASQEQTIGGGRGTNLPVQFVIQAPELGDLRPVLPKMMSAATASPVFQVVDLNLKFNKPELVISIDRDRARAMGVTVRDIAEAIQLLFSGQRYGFFILNGKQYPVIGLADRPFRDDPMDLSTVSIRNRQGSLVPLENLVTVDYRSNPPQLYRFNRLSSATVSAGLNPGYSLSEGIETMQSIADSLLNDSFTTTLSGISREFMESSNTLWIAFLLALILIYLILSAQFESFSDPLLIMMTVPLAITGAVLSLWVTGQTLNIFSQIGMIMLIGIVTKNGILIVEFANQKMEAGLSRSQAAVEAATQRFRPILMTSLATVLGALPIAMALGAGAESRVSMGIVIIGGLLFSLVLTLFIIPSLVAIFGRNRPIIPGHGN
ncbi:MAG: efflux RND transporter permease subunit [Bacteroidetes bacterium]|nr:efflux RND transporter permease subunit [Bacteroidota bacterium]